MHIMAFLTKTLVFIAFITIVNAGHHYNYDHQYSNLQNYEIPYYGSQNYHGILANKPQLQDHYTSINGHNSYKNLVKPSYQYGGDNLNYYGTTGYNNYYHKGSHVFGYDDISHSNTYKNQDYNNYNSEKYNNYHQTPEKYQHAYGNLPYNGLSTSNYGYSKYY